MLAKPSADENKITSAPAVIFSGCTSLKSVEIPDSVTIIGEGAFQICTSLTSITVPGSAESIENHAFGYTYKGYECILIDGFTIYGYDGTAAETYANDNGITFVSLGEYVAPEEPTTAEPTTEEPTKAEPTTEEPTTEEPITEEATTAELSTEELTTTEALAFTVSDESVAIDEGSRQITISAGTSPEAFAAMIASGSAKVVSADGVELTANYLIGTGCKVQTLDEIGNVVSEYEVIVPFDVDGNGKITAADARVTLRTAAQLDTLEGVYAIAPDFDADSAIKPADARSILRVAAKLD